MARRRRWRSVDWLIEQIDQRLQTLGESRHNLSLRDKVLRIAEIYEDVKDLGVNAIAEDGLKATGARERIRLYLISYVDTIIEGIELAVVSGISDYPRRVRELRVELGYHIASGATPDPSAGIDLRPDQYCLMSAERDEDAARRWHIANRIRRGGGGSKSRLLRYLMENPGSVVTTEELAYVARDAREFARRVRELRTEEGYLVATRFTGRPDLGSGEYVLQSVERIAEPHDRHVPDAVQRAVYERDRNSCRLCGWNIERWANSDPRILELHHLEHHRDGGPNVERNLVVLCSKCHDDVHAGKHSEPLQRIIDSL